MPPKIPIYQSPRGKTVLQKIGFMDIAGFELYENVILAYDSDIDSRLREVVDRVTTYFRSDLVLVYEQDGIISMLWKGKIPEAFHVGQSIATTNLDGSIDFWNIGFSKATIDVEKEHKEKFWLGDFNPN